MDFLKGFAIASLLWIIFHIITVMPEICPDMNSYWLGRHNRDKVAPIEIYIPSKAIDDRGCGFRFLYKHRYIKVYISPTIIHPGIGKR